MTVMRQNKLRELLNTEQPSVGTHVQSTWPSIVEMVGHTGMFDYIEFVGAYAPYDLYDLDNICRAADLFGMSAMMTIEEEPRGFLAQRAIGSGFHSVLFADSRTVEDARECVRSVRPETPEVGGRFGSASRRMAYPSYGGSKEYVQALKEIVVVLMIEKKSAVDQLDEILAVDGIDMIQWGGVDYSLSIGRPGARNDPDVKAVERKVIEACVEKGIPPRAEIRTTDEADYYLDLGVRHFCIGTDITILHDWLKENGEDLRKRLS